MTTTAAATAIIIIKILNYLCFNIVKQMCRFRNKKSYKIWFKSVDIKTVSIDANQSSVLILLMKSLLSAADIIRYNLWNCLQNCILRFGQRKQSTNLLQ